MLSTAVSFTWHSRPLRTGCHYSDPDSWDPGTYLVSLPVPNNVLDTSLSCILGPLIHGCQLGDPMQRTRSPLRLVQRSRTLALNSEEQKRVSRDHCRGRTCNLLITWTEGSIVVRRVAITPGGHKQLRLIMLYRGLARTTTATQEYCDTMSELNILSPKSNVFRSTSKRFPVTPGPS